MQVDDIRDLTRKMTVSRVSANRARAALSLD